jgi:hypothetical protein
MKREGSTKATCRPNNYAKPVKPNRFAGQRKGLIESLRNAKTVAQVDKLISVAKEYEFLSKDTARKANKIATSVRNSLVVKQNKKS